MNAIISCHDKAGLKEFAAELARINPEIKIFSSSGTYSELAGVAGKNLVEIASYTGFPEMPGGLVKTLHPKIHAGLLADINDGSHIEYMKKNGIEAFDLVVVNLYPFEKKVSEKKSFEETRQNIDIGGVSLIEAASKNFLRVAVVTDPSDYRGVLEAMRKGGTSKELRLKLAKKAFLHLSNYIEAVSNYFEKLKAEDVR